MCKTNERFREKGADARFVDMSGLDRMAWFSGHFASVGVDEWKKGKV
jgi:hypothetical protein